jgi:exodeoxyribonuclease VII small subunit
MLEKEQFTKNYGKLKEISEHLRTQKEVNIDELIPMVEQATAAYKVCQERLNTVKEALEKYMPESIIEPKDQN